MLDYDEKSAKCASLASYHTYRGLFLISRNHCKAIERFTSIDRKKRHEDVLRRNGIQQSSKG